MALAVTSTTAAANNQNSLVITKPTGVTVGDLLLILVGAADNVACTGFTSRLVNANTDGNVDGYFTLLSRVADASDVSASNYTITSSSESLGAGAMLRVTGGTFASNPLFSNAAANVTIDSASYTLNSGVISLVRPAETLLIIAGVHMSNSNTADYGTFAVQSTDSNPTWTTVTGGLDFQVKASTDDWENNSFFCAYAITSVTSTVTGYTVAVSSSTLGNADSDASSLMLFVPVVDATGTNALLEVQPAFFDNAGVEVGGNGTNALLAVSPEIFDQNGVGTTPTQWSTTPKSTPGIWTPTPKS